MLFNVIFSLGIFMGWFTDAQLPHNLVHRAHTPAPPARPMLGAKDKQWFLGVHIGTSS